MLQRLATTLVLSLLTLSFMWPSEAAIDGEGLHLALAWQLAAALCAFAFREKFPMTRMLRTGGTLGLFLLVAGFWLSTWHVFEVEGDRRAAVNLSLHWSAVLAAAMALSCVFTNNSNRTLALLLFVGLVAGCAFLGLIQHHVTYKQQAEWYQGQRTRLDDLISTDDYQSSIERREIETEFSRMQIPLAGAARELFERRLLASSEPIGPFALANTLAGFLAAAIVLLTGFCLSSTAAEDGNMRSTMLRLLPVLLVVGYCLVLTKSRTAWVALFVGLAAVAVMGRFQAKAVGRLLSVSFGVLVLLLAAGIGTGALDKEVVLESPRSLQFRLFYWMGASGVIKESPVFGAGPGNFRQAYLVHKPLETSEEILDPHNIFLDAWCSAGLFGFAGVIVIALSAFRGTVVEDQSVASVVPRLDKRLGFQSLVLAVLLHQLWLWYNGAGFLLTDERDFAESSAAATLVPLGAAVLLMLVSRTLSCDRRTVFVAISTLLVHLLGAGGLQIVIIGFAFAVLFAAAENSAAAATSKSGPVGAVLSATMSLSALVAGVQTLNHGLVPYLRSEQAVAESEHFQARNQIDRAVQALEPGIAADPIRVSLRQRMSELATYRFMSAVNAHARLGDAVQGADSRKIRTEERVMPSMGTELVQPGQTRTFRDARKLASDRIESDRRNWHGYFERSQILQNSAGFGFEKDSLQSAHDDLLKAIDLYPTNVQLWVARTRLSISSRRTEAAANAARETLRIEESNREWGHIDRYLAPEDLHFVEGVIENRKD